MMVGTTENQVTSNSAHWSQNRLAEKRGQITEDPPDTSGPITVTPNPLMW